MIKCDQRAKAKCPFKKTCCDDEVAYFLEGSECDQFNQKVLSPRPTNADLIRAMTDEELAWFMADRNVNESTLLLMDKDHGLTAVEKDALRCNIYCALRKWLQQPAEGE